MHPADGVSVEDVLHGGKERAEDGAGVDDDDGVAGLVIGGGNMGERHMVRNNQGCIGR